MSVKELRAVIDALTDVVQDNYTTRIKAESALHELVQKGEISPRAGDRVISAMGSCDEY